MTKTEETLESKIDKILSNIEKKPSLSSRGFKLAGRLFIAGIGLMVIVGVIGAIIVGVSAGG